MTIENRAGNQSGAVEAAQQALALVKSWAATHAGDASDTSLAAAYERLAGLAHSTTGDLNAARTSYLETIRLREVLARRQNTVAAQISLARAYNLYGDLLASPLELNLGEVAEAMGYYRRSLAIRAELMQRDPGNISTAIDVAFTLLNISSLERDSAPKQAVATL